MIKIRVDLLNNGELVLGKIWREDEYHSYMNKKISDIIQRELNISDDMMHYFKLQKKIKYTELTPTELIGVMNGIHSVLTGCIYEVRVYVDDIEIPLE